MLSSHLCTQSFFAERFFHIFDKDKTDHISHKELKDGLLLLTSGSEVDKLRFLFQIYDIDGRYNITWWIDIESCEQGLPFF